MITLYYIDFSKLLVWRLRYRILSIFLYLLLGLNPKTNISNNPQNKRNHAQKCNEGVDTRYIPMACGFIAEFAAGKVTREEK